MTDPIESLALKFAKTVNRIEPSASIENVRFMAAYYINFYSVIVITLIFGIVTNELFATALGVVSFYYFRKITDGFHFSSLTICALVTILVLSIAPHISLNILEVQIINFFSLLLIIRFSGLNVKEERVIYAVVFLNCVCAIAVVSWCFFIQSLTLISAKEKLKYDR